MTGMILILKAFDHEGREDTKKVFWFSK